MYFPIYFEMSAQQVRASVITFEFDRLIDTNTKVPQHP